MAKSTLKLAAGAVIEEADGRVWLAAPSNQFGGCRNTFPKGRVTDGLSPQATAIKEVFEEIGLCVEITGYLMDVPRTTTLTRYYSAKRVGGNPVAMGWESQAVHLVPKARLYGFLNMATDFPLAQAIAAGKPPG